MFVLPAHLYSQAGQWAKQGELCEDMDQDKIVLKFKNL